MKNNKIYIIWGAIITLTILGVFGYWDIKTNNIESVTNLEKKINQLEAENSKLKSGYNSLLNYNVEMSGIPNEKRKAIFELKIKQDSALVNLLLNDIRANKEILKLLETEWVFNDSTEFVSLKNN